MARESVSGTSAGELPMEFLQVLKEVKYPINRNEIVDQARSIGVAPEILMDLGMIPDKKYNSADEIMKSYKERVSKAARQ